MGNQVERRRTLVNFGRNLRWQALCYRPRNDDDVLEILGGSAGGKAARGSTAW